MIFAFERIARNRPYPNLGTVDAIPGTAAWYEFSRTWPYVEPWSVWEYFIQERIPNIHARTVQDLGREQAWYPIVFTFFDHAIDYIDLIPDATKKLLIAGQLRLLFYYSEGDNPAKIKQRLWDLCLQHNIDPAAMRIVTANSACDQIPGMLSFADDEMLYRLRNRHDPLPWNHARRIRDFTALVRTHKTWRAWTMAWLWNQDIDQRSWFSYDIDTLDADADRENPLDSGQISGIRSISEKFLSAAPYVADALDSKTRNDYHSGHVVEHYAESYINIILETHMDVDQSGGIFLTEKTFKPIKHCQPFVIFGAAGSLDKLKQMGYRTFDSVIDPLYDSITDTTQRWLCLQDTISELARGDLYQIAQTCREDCEHNQRVFLSSKQERLNSLLGKLNNDNQ